MAEALLRHAGRGRLVVDSAGTIATRVHPGAIAAMSEIGIDISGARSKHLDEFVGEDFDHVITVCDSANESCPIFPGNPNRIHWSIDDPSVVEGTDAERARAFASARDEIAQRIERWIETIDDTD